MDKYSNEKHRRWLSGLQLPQVFSCSPNHSVPPSMPLARHILVTISELLYMCIYVVMTKIGQVKNLQEMQ